MDANLTKKIASAYHLEKYDEKLRLCRFYLCEIENDRMTQLLFDEANKFSEDTYKEICAKNPIIAELNTCMVTRCVTPIDELRLNLEALARMMLEMEGKELEDIVWN